MFWGTYIYIYIYKYTASTTSQLTGLGMCRLYQIVFSGVIYCSAHQDICRSVYILLALPFSSLGWVCAGSTRLHIEYEFFGAHTYKYTASTAIQLTGLGMCRFYQIPYSGEIYWSAHKDKCRYVYILLALPCSSLGWVRAAST